MPFTTRIMQFNREFQASTQQLVPPPLSGVAEEALEKANEVDVLRLTDYWTLQSLERIINSVGSPVLFNVELICKSLKVYPGDLTFLTTSYVESLGLRKIAGHLIVNPMETNCVIPLTETVRYVTVEGMLDWLAQADHPDAPEVRGALLWLYSYASRRAARMKLASSEAVISQLETDLANAIDERNRAQRAVSTLQATVETKDRCITFLSEQLDMEEDMHMRTKATLSRKKRKCAIVHPVCNKRKS
jgi:hypothetical protein